MPWILSLRQLCPAQPHTGLRRGDRIVRVNGRVPVAGNPASLAEALRAAGMFGHELELVPADARTTPPVVRLPVPVPTVYALEVVNTRDGIGYLRVGAFRDTTPRELDEAVFRLKDQGVRALIIDLRGNPGGLFTAGVEVAQRFLPAGIIVTTRGQSPEFAGRVFSSDSGMSAFDIPLVLASGLPEAKLLRSRWREDLERRIGSRAPTLAVLVERGRLGHFKEDRFEFLATRR